MVKISKNNIGLKVGLFLSAVHLIWALFVATIPSTLQSFLDWIFRLHFIKPVWILTQFNLFDAISLVILTFVVGYCLGWLFAAIWNWKSK